MLTVSSIQKGGNMNARFKLSEQVQKRLVELDLTAEEIIRKVLDLKREGFDAGYGVVLSEGTHLLAWYKERPYGAVVKDGFIMMEGKVYDSLSGAAGAITGRPTTNGWAIWMVKAAGKNEFIPILNMRKSA